MEKNKKFIGRCTPGNYENQVNIGIKKEDIEFLMQNLNKDGWVNLRLNKGKDSGKPYIEFVFPKPADSTKTPTDKLPF